MFVSLPSDYSVRFTDSPLSLPVFSRLSFATFAQSSFKPGVSALCVCLSASLDVHGIGRPEFQRGRCIRPISQPIPKATTAVV